MNMKIKNDFMNEAGNDGAPSGGGDNQQQQQTQQPGATESQSILSQGANNQGPTDSQDWLQEKYRVTKQDGSIDIEASARKVAEAHRHLEQRMGAGEAPPKTPEEYAPKVEVEGFNLDEFKADPKSQAFMKGAHAKGINNDQLSFILGEYYKLAPELVQGAKQLDTEQVVAELKQEWKTDTEYQQNISGAHKAFMAFASDADKQRMDEIGNNPVVIRLLANIAKEMKEDVPVHGEQNQPADFATKAAELRSELETLKPTDPRRKGVQDQLDQLYARRYGTKQQRLGGGANISLSA